MTRELPGPRCYDLRFQAGYPIAEPASVALEDYTRSTTQCDASEVARAGDDPSVVVGVHVCGLSLAITPAVLNDVEGFARSLATGSGGGLGWS